jgi:Rha family phage regulatory protein
MNNVSAEVVEIDGKLMASSLNIAEVFGKRHDNVLRVIDNILQMKELGLLTFEESSYTDIQNKKQRMILLDEEFTTILIMGFTGKEAIKFKLLYTQEFIRMRNLLNSHQQQSKELTKKEILKLALESEEKIEKLQLEVAEKDKEIAEKDSVIESLDELINDLTNVKDLYTRKEVVAKLGLKSLHKFCQWLRDIKVVHRVNGNDIPYADIKRKGLVVVRSVLMNDKFYDNIYITSKGLSSIAKRLKEKNELEYA